MRFFVVSLIASLACGCGADTNSVSKDEPKKFLPASAAGTSTAASPGVPADFAGAVQESRAISQEELDAIKASKALATNTTSHTA